MTKHVLALAGIAALASALAAVFIVRDGTVTTAPPAAAIPTVSAKVSAKTSTPTLYCEFYNVVGRSPKVGFTFAVGGTSPTPAYAQVSQMEMDGTRADFEPGPSRPAWGFDGSDSPATLTSPDGAIVINLYGYDPAKSGGDSTKPVGGWIEAGLRSIQYLNLDGKCRRSAA